MNQMNDERKTGKEIIDGIIAALKGVVAAAETAESKNDQALVAARVRLGEAVAPALTPERKEWLQEEVNRKALYVSWVESYIAYVVQLEEFGFTKNWTVVDVRTRCIEVAEHLEQLEPIARKRAEAAKEKVLTDLLG